MMMKQSAALSSSSSASSSRRALAAAALPAPQRLRSALKSTRCRDQKVALRSNYTRAATSEASTTAATNGRSSSKQTTTAPREAGAPSLPPLSLTATLLVQCPDAKGVVASLSQLLYGYGCNIMSSDQFSDVDTNMFFQRISFDYSELLIGVGNTPTLERAIGELATRFNMKWRISYDNKLKRVALLVSKLDHCLYDLLIRHRSGELQCQIPMIISNHPDLEPIARMFEVPFHVLPLSNKADKPAQEAALEKLISDNDIDIIVLARYMQIFSPEFCNRHWEHTINIHHSFLPAFEGAKPYHRAHERGVKIIGATAHFATSELDAGPIIDQNTTRITHRDSVSDMIRKGRDLERLVLARALRWHLDDRVLVYGNKTVVFED